MRYRVILLFLGRWCNSNRWRIYQDHDKTACGNVHLTTMDCKGGNLHLDPICCFTQEQVHPMTFLFWLLLWQFVCSHRFGPWKYRLYTLITIPDEIPICQLRACRISSWLAFIPHLLPMKYPSSFSTKNDGDNQNMVQHIKCYKWLWNNTVMYCSTNQCLICSCRSRLVPFLNMSLIHTSPMDTLLFCADVDMGYLSTRSIAIPRPAKGLAW